MNKLAVIDWGIGGLGFHREWKRLRPDEAIEYFSDSGYIPYGKVDTVELAQRLIYVMEWLKKERGVTHIVVACNAASSVLELLHVDGLVVVGIIGMTVEWIESNADLADLSVVGGMRTVESRAYSGRLKGRVVKEVLGQVLSAHVEAGELNGQAVERSINNIFEGVEGDVVLACTHYVALMPVLETCYPELRFWDPIPAIAQSLSEQWQEFVRGEDNFGTTGDVVQTQVSAKLAFDVVVDKIYACQLS